MIREWRTRDLVYKTIQCWAGVGELRQDFKDKNNEGKAFIMVLWEKVAFFLELG